MFGKVKYEMEVLYIEPLSMDLQVNPLVRDDTAYCDHGTGSALRDAEVVPDSQIT